MAKQRISVGVNLDPENPTAGDLGGLYVPGTTNFLYSKYTDGRTYAETRPAISIVTRKPEEQSDGKGRGIFYWESADKLLVVYNDTIYEGLYGPLPHLIDAGRDPVYFAEWDFNTLIMTDPENNKVWKITHSSGLITVTDHTPNVNPDLITEGLAGGVVVLDNYCFLMSKAGKIYNSDVGDIDTWNALNFLTTERAVDAGVYICKQNEHIIAVSSSSTEVFYDAANPVGSPLKRRADIAYQIGASNYKLCATNGTKLYFIGATSLGSFSVFKVENLKLQQVAHQSIDAWINNNLVSYQRDFMVTCATLGEHFIVYLTSISSIENDTVWEPINTAVFDDSTSMWGRFETGVVAGTELDDSFPIFAITERTGTVAFGQSFIFADGSIGIFSLENTGVDLVVTDPYITEDGLPDSPQEYWDAGYIIRETGEERYPINPSLVTEEWDGGLINNKFMSKLSVVGRIRDRTVDTNSTLCVQYSDDVLRTWSSKRTIDATTHWRWTRLGYFQRRSIFICYEGDDRVRIEAIEVDVEASEYA